MQRLWKSSSAFALASRARRSPAQPLVFFSASATTTMTRYEQALQLLSQLQSNRAVTGLFAPSVSPSATDDLNALAIPEMRAWLARAGYTPQDLAALRCVHVAGTKGKGSVAALTAAILARRERKKSVVGTYSSPHVVSVRERIALDGEPLDRERFARYFFEVWDRLTEAARLEGAPPETAEGPASKPFYFRFLTILAWHVFLREGVRSAVIECGIGGEHDPTNVLPAEAVTAAVVTQLGVDHVAMLGDTADKIAWHKAGIFKEGVTAFTRRDGSEDVMGVLRQRAREKGASLVEIADEDVEAWDGVEDAALQGPFQKHNMALAVAAAREHIMKLGGRFDGEFGRDDGYRYLAAMPAEFRDGLQAATLRGRCEVFCDADGVEWFLDGAHTADSVAGVAQWFAARVPVASNVRRILLFNQQERDPEPLLQTLLSSVSGEDKRKKESSAFDLAVFTRNEESPPAGGPARDLSVQERACEVAAAFDPAIQTASRDAVASSLELVRQFAQEARSRGESCKVLVTGSFHLVGPVIKSIEHVECSASM